MHGRGVYKSKSGSIYEGEYMDGKKHGAGVYLSKGGNEYEGIWENDKKVSI